MTREVIDPESINISKERPSTLQRNRGGLKTLQLETFKGAWRVPKVTRSESFGGLRETALTGEQPRLSSFLNFLTCFLTNTEMSCECPFYKTYTISPVFDLCFSAPC